MKSLQKYFDALIKNDRNVSLFLLGMLFLKVTILLIGEGRAFLYDDGWYYANIARSIIDGHGFANPFFVTTGPTAWVPPMYVYLFVIMFETIGDNLTSLYIIDLIQMTGYALCFYALLKTWKCTRFTKNNYILLLIYLIIISGYKMHIFRMITDLWIYMLLFSLVLYALVSYVRFNKRFLLLVLLSAIIPLAAPTIAPGFVCILGIVFFSGLAFKIGFPKLQIFRVVGRTHFFQLFFLSVVFSLSLSIWGYRNYTVFHKVILSKSNQWFEFYLCNIKDEDGILSESTVEKFHPDANRKAYRPKIYALGEAEWLHQYELMAQVYLKEHRREYYKKMMNRCRNIFIFTESDNDLIHSEFLESLPLAFRNKLINNELITGESWICLSDSDSVTQANIKKCIPSKGLELVSDYQECRKRWEKTKYSKSYLFLGLFIALFPALSLLYLWVYKFKNNQNTILILTIIYLIYTIPYILISHELRYQQPLFSIQTFILAITLTDICGKISKSKITNFVLEKLQFLN